MLWQNGQLLPLKAAESFQGQHITALLKDRQGTNVDWCEGRGRFSVYEGKLVPLTGDGVQELLKDSHCLLMDQTGRMWIGAGEDFVLCNEGGSLASLPNSA